MRLEATLATLLMATTTIALAPSRARASDDVGAALAAGLLTGALVAAVAADADSHATLRFHDPAGNEIYGDAYGRFSYHRPNGTRHYVLRDHPRAGNPLFGRRVSTTTPWGDVLAYHDDRGRAVYRDTYGRHFHIAYRYGQRERVYLDAGYPTVSYGSDRFPYRDGYGRNVYLSSPCGLLCTYDADYDGNRTYLR